MRKENSDFVTKFITSPGSFNKNRDYFAFVELDNMACWVMADGLDSDQEMLSAKLAVGSVISDFTEKPSMKRRDIKKYIKNANQFLIQESRMMSLQAAILVVVSDYNSIVWGSVGNTRLYHLRKEKINFKSKDHSVAQMMVEIGDIEEQQLNQHEERNNLTEYLGKEKRIKPNIHKKEELKDDDVLLMCTSGFWENMADQELESVLKDSKEAKEFVDNLEDKLLSKEVKEFDNYTVASIFANKVFQQNVNSDRFPVKKVAAILIPICIFAGGFFTYGKMKQHTAKIKAKKARQVKLTKGEEEEKAGEKLFKEGEYSKSLEKYKEAQKIYNELNKKEELTAVKERIKTVNKILAGKDLEREGNNKFKSEEYKEALDKYKKAKLVYLKIDEYNLQEIEDQISRTEDVLKAEDYAREGDMSFKAEDYSLAREKYIVALEIFKEQELPRKEKIINNKITKVEGMIEDEKKSERARKIESEGDKFFNRQDYQKANLKYMEAKVIYTELEMSEERTRIEEKLAEVASRRNEGEAEKYLQLAFEYLQEDNYEKASFNYKQAREIYSQLGKPERVDFIQQKLDDIVVQRKAREAEELITAADKQLKNKNFDQALSYYREAEAIYADSGMREESNELKERITKVKLQKAKGCEARGDKQVEQEEYDQALVSYNQAKEIYAEINKSTAQQEVEKKIEEVKKAGDKIFLFF